MPVQARLPEQRQRGRRGRQEGVRSLQREPLAQPARPLLEPAAVGHALQAPGVPLARRLPGRREAARAVQVSHRQSE